VIVTIQIISAQGQPIEMDWQLGISDGRYKIQDVSIDGVSAAMSRRDDVARRWAGCDAARDDAPRGLSTSVQKGGHDLCPGGPPPGHPIIAE
jgi:hypothetical protein